MSISFIKINIGLGQETDIIKFIILFYDIIFRTFVLIKQRHAPEMLGY